MFNDSHSDSEYQPSTLPADIVLFCDTGASLFKAIVKQYSLKVDWLIAEELGYLNLHQQQRTQCGLFVNYLEFVFYSHTEERTYRITRFDTFEDAVRCLLSEPHKQRGAVLVYEDLNTYDNIDEPIVEPESTAKSLIRTAFGFICVAVLFNEVSLMSRDVGQGEWVDKAMNFSENGFVDKGMVIPVDGSTQAMLTSNPGHCRKQNEWWCPSPEERLQFMLSFFHARLPHNHAFNEICPTSRTLRTRHLTKILTARFYCFDVREGGSQITTTDELKISIAGNLVTEGRIVDSPGLAIESGKLCQSNVLILLTKAVAADSRDHFVVRRMDGTTVGIGVIVSCG